MSNTQAQSEALQRAWQNGWEAGIKHMKALAQPDAPPAATPAPAGQNANDLIDEFKRAAIAWNDSHMENGPRERYRNAHAALYAALAQQPAPSAEAHEQCAKLCEQVAEEFGGVAEGPFATDFGKAIHEAMAAGALGCAVAIRQATAPTAPSTGGDKP